MAAYAHTTTLTRAHVTKVSPGRLGILSGKTDLSNFNATLVEVTKITDQFSDGAPDVIVTGVSDNGFLVRWDRTNKAFSAYDVPHAATTTVLAAAADDADIGEFDWVALGLI